MTWAQLKQALAPKLPGADADALEVLLAFGDELEEGGMSAMNSIPCISCMQAANAAPAQPRSPAQLGAHVCNSTHPAPVQVMQLCVLSQMPSPGLVSLQTDTCPKHV
jgi:hypothetical protein